VQLGYSTWGMPGVRLDVALPHLAQLGFDGVELTVVDPGGFKNIDCELSLLDTPKRRQIRELLDRTGLLLTGLHAGTARFLAQDDTERAASVRRLEETVRLAVDLAGGEAPPPVVATVGGRPEEWEQVKHQLAEEAGRFARFAGSYGVTYAVEPHVGSALDRPEKAAWLIETVGLPHLRINFDISHFNVIGLSIEETVPVMAPLAAHTHVKDERGRAPAHQFLIPGEGEFDYVRYLKAMQAAGYTGCITVEISVMVQRRPDYAPLAAAEQSYRVLARAFEQAGIARARR
jgi:sugar phosphate isomerase/epimerase